MKTFFILLFSGLALGAVYSLVALGFVVIYRSSQVFNFAHGEFLAFGAFLMASLTSTDAIEKQAIQKLLSLAGWLALLGGAVLVGWWFWQLWKRRQRSASDLFPFPKGVWWAGGTGALFLLLAPQAKWFVGLPWGVGLLLAMVATGALAALTERLFLRPMVGQPIFATIILTIFLGFLLRTCILVLWGTETRYLNTPWDPLAEVKFLGQAISMNDLLTMGAGLLALLGFFLIMRYTKLGVAMRATSNDQEAALSLGIPVGRIFGATWFMAGVFAAFAGVFLILPPKDLDANIGYIALNAFPAMIIGGLDSAAGAVIAGLALGLLEVMTKGYINPHLGEFGKNFHTVFPYLAMILFLMVRPYGIFGSKEVKRV